MVGHLDRPHRHPTGAMVVSPHRAHQPTRDRLGAILLAPEAPAPTARNRVTRQPPRNNLPSRPPVACHMDNPMAMAEAHRPPEATRRMVNRHHRVVIKEP